MELERPQRLEANHTVGSSGNSAFSGSEPAPSKERIS
jgi:hypothetical protein